MNPALNVGVQWVLPVVVAVLLLWAIVALIRWLTPRREGARAIGQVLQLAAFVVAVVLVVLALPFADSTQGQLLSLFGIVFTGVIGLASTSFVSNAMAGFMLRSVSGFHGGDFVRVGDYFGRVTETALFHTEIQNEDRDLVTLPNLYLITHPVEVVRSDGTLISANVSLGYDVNRRRVREVLIEAAERAELTDAFVQVTELGDFSVGYRVSAFLHDVSGLVTRRSSLRGHMLDALHEAGIEIVSPTFMNQIPRKPDEPVLPGRYHVSDDEEQGRAETLMFDKAEMAGRVKKIQDQRERLLSEIAELKGNPQTQEFELGWRQRQVESLDEILASLSAGADEAG